MSAVLAQVTDPPPAPDAQRYDVRGAIREMLADPALSALDEGEIAVRFVDGLSNAEARTVLLTVTGEYVRAVRRGDFGLAVNAATSAGGATKPKSRWDQIDRAALAKLRARVLKEQVRLPGGRKEFGRCTPDDVRFLADDRFKRSQDNLRWANRFDRVCKAMQSADVATVAELGDAVVGLMADA